MKTLSSHTLSLKSDHKALVAYVTAGMDNWQDCIKSCADNGADIIEIGLPFSDPIMDGPVIAKASAQALKNGAKTYQLLEDVKNLEISIPKVVMTYANVLYSHGFHDSISKILDAGVTGLILPDLTYERTNEISNTLSNADLSFIPLVSSTTDEARLQKIISSAEGFLYCVAIKGVTGQDVKLDASSAFIKSVSNRSAVPAYSGVGIRTPEDAKTVSQNCDGVIVGTAIVEKMFEENSVEEISKLVSQFREALNG